MKTRSYSPLMDFSQRIKASSLILTKKTICGSSGDHILAINVKKGALEVIIDHFAKGFTLPLFPKIFSNLFS